MAKNINKNPESKKKAYNVAEWALEKQAHKPVILDVRATLSFCDYFVICSGETNRQVEAICEGVRKQCKENKINIAHVEKDESAQWILLDLSDVILHIFIEEARGYYDLEYLWKQAKRVGMPKKKK